MCDDLKPVVVFWDLENINVPKQKSAFQIVSTIRKKFFNDHREAEFICICDTLKERRDRCLTRSKLSSGDVNFASELSDLRHGKKFDIVLIHNNDVHHALTACATTIVLYNDLISEMQGPLKPTVHQDNESWELEITGYSPDVKKRRLQSRLKQLSTNCGGKVICVKEDVSIIRFQSKNDAVRARKRMDGENVFGNKIKVELAKKSPQTGDKQGQRGFKRPKDTSGQPPAWSDTGQHKPELDPKQEENSSPAGKVNRTPNNNGKSLSRTPTPPGSYPRTYYQPFYNNPASMYAKTLESFSSKNRTNHDNRSSDHQKTTNIQILTNNNRHKGNSDVNSTDTSKNSPPAHPKPPSPPVKKNSSPVPRINKSPAEKKPSPKAVTTQGQMSIDNQKPQPRHDTDKHSPSTKPDSEGEQLSQYGIKDDNNVSISHVGGKSNSHDNKLHDTVNKFSRDGKGSSRHVLMLQQQLYQEDQQHQDVRRQYHGRSYSPPPYTSWSTYDYHDQPHDMTFDSAYTPYQHFGNGNYDYRPYSSYTASNNYGGQYNCCYRGGNFWNQYNNRYPSQRPPPPCNSPPNCTTMCSTVVQQKWSHRCSPYEMIEDSSQRQSPVNMFRPINTPSHGTCSPAVEDEDLEWDGIVGPVELLVSNLDYNISAKEWRKILFTTFHPHVRVLNVHVKTQPDNTSIGMVKVPNIEEARFAISQFHRKKIGYKRIHVTLKQEEMQRPASSTRAEAIALLSEAKDNVLPLFKFIELFDKRYHRTISVSELYKMRDTIEIHEHGGAGRMVHLVNNPSLYQTPPPPLVTDQDMYYQQQQMYGLTNVAEVLEQPACPIHCPEGSIMYAEAVNNCMLPNVMMTIKMFGPQVHSLLQSHDGNMPLMSFAICFSAEFGCLPIVGDNGIPLEHLISCVHGIEIQVSPSGVKKVQWAENKPLSPPDSPTGGSNPLLSQQLNQFSREMIELLKSCPKCRMPFSKFIPSYHHYYNRQCRVADYGYSRLKDLFDAIPHALQVLGTGERKVLTLSHRAQIRRFTADLQKVIKAQYGKQLHLSDFPDCYASTMGKPFDVVEYGMACVEDLISDVSPASIIVLQEENDTILAIPRKDQTPEEIERTKQFALEVVDLLRHNPQCRMPFNKFIPSYHHHFGRQCRVSDYGFTKLLDLFESIPHIVDIEEEGEERLIHLTEPELRKVLADQIIDLLKTQKNQCLPLHHLMSAFTCHFGFNIPLQDFHVESEEELMKKLKHVVKVDMVNRCKYIRLVDRHGTPELARQVLQLLMDQSCGSLPLVELCSRYKSIFGRECDVSRLKDELLDYVQISGDDESGVISLTSLQVFARDVRILLQNGLQIYVSDFERVYKDHFGVELKPALYGYNSVESLLESIPHVIKFQGKPPRHYVQLSHDLDGNTLASPEPASVSPLLLLRKSPTSDSRTLKAVLPSIHDLLSDPVPSSVPSPDLQPREESPADLISFDLSSYSNLADKLWGLSDDEKRGLKTPLCMTPTSELLQLAAKCLVNRPPADVASKEEVSSLSEMFKNGWWKEVKDEEVWRKDSKGDDFVKKDGKTTDINENITDVKTVDDIKSALNFDTRRTNDKQTEISCEEYAHSQLKQAGIDMESQSKKQCLSKDSISYETMFRRELPVETSSVRSDTSIISDISQDSPTKKSPRKPRLAAKFDIPIDGGNH